MEPQFNIVTDRDETGYLGLMYKEEMVLYEMDSPAHQILLHYYNNGEVRPIPDWLAAILYWEMIDDEVSEYEDDDEPAPDPVS